MEDAFSLCMKTDENHERNRRTADRVPTRSGENKAPYETFALKDDAAFVFDGEGVDVAEVGGAEVLMIEDVVDEVGALTSTPFRLTLLPESAAFWYEVPLLITSARDLKFHPLLAIKGNELMNAVTVIADVSCSRIITPGVLGMARNLFMLSWMGCVEA